MKKDLLRLAFTVMAATLFVSCQKNDVPQTIEKVQPTKVEVDLPNESGIGLRADQYSVFYQKAVDIISDSLACNILYDVDDVYCLGNFSGGYVFCVPSSFQYHYLIVVPSKSCAFVIHDLEHLPNFQQITQRPPTFYKYEIMDACCLDVICEGRVYAQSGNTAFTVTSADMSNLNTLEYNLLPMFCCLAVGSYSYQGAIQGQYTMLSRDEFLFSIAKECYYHFCCCEE